MEATAAVRILPPTGSLPAAKISFFFVQYSSCLMSDFRAQDAIGGIAVRKVRALRHVQIYPNRIFVREISVI